MTVAAHPAAAGPKAAAVIAQKLLRLLRRDDTVGHGLLSGGCVGALQSRF